MSGSDYSRKFVGALLLGSFCLGSAAWADPCSVPGSHLTLAEAIADSGCDPITLGVGSFTASVAIDRSLSLLGSGADLTQLVGLLDVGVLSIGSAADVELQGLALSVHADSVQDQALTKAAGATVSLSEVRVSTAPPVVPPPPLDDAVALWNFANEADSLGRESDFATTGTFSVGNVASLSPTFAANADGFVGQEGAAPNCSPSWGSIFDVPGNHELSQVAGGSMTMWARFKMAAFDGIDDLFRFGSIADADQGTYELELDTQRALFSVLGSGDTVETSLQHGTQLSPDSWYDVAGIFDADAHALFILVHDPETGGAVGSPVAEFVSFSTLQLPEDLILLFLEAPFNANGCNTGGQLEMAAVWNRALSFAEVRQLSIDPLAGALFVDGFESGDTTAW
ncbi:MAG: LamG domain-containing protein [Thermoanaerobaculia bacterium]|nr:LamG domain-containing protein [Thermoanaerobaculia bacterium]